MGRVSDRVRIIPVGWAKEWLLYVRRVYPYPAGVPTRAVLDGRVYYIQELEYDPQDGYLLSFSTSLHKGVKVPRGVCIFNKVKPGSPTSVIRQIEAGAPYTDVILESCRRAEEKAAADRARKAEIQVAAEEVERQRRLLKDELRRLRAERGVDHYQEIRLVRMLLKEVK